MSNHIIGFGGSELIQGDLIYVAHGQYLNVGMIHRIITDVTNGDGPHAVEVLQMYGWYRHDRDGSNLRGYGRDGMLKTQFKTYPRNYFFKLAPAPFVETTGIGRLFLQSAEIRLAKLRR